MRDASSCYAASPSDPKNDELLDWLLDAWYCETSFCNCLYRLCVEVDEEELLVELSEVVDELEDELESDPEFSS